MKKNRIAAMMMTMLALSGCGKEAMPSSAPLVSSEETVTILTATDLHYLSPSLTDYGEPFIRMLERGDGKLTEKSEEIVDQLILETEQAEPDALLLTGDLTFNGELQSLKDLKGKLEKLEEDGITVLVLPGNHDIAYPYAYRFEGDQAYPVDSISSRQFKEEMKAFGYEDAYARDPDSFSYVYALRDNLWLLAVDCNTEEDPGSVKESTLQWIEKELKEAKQKGIQVIAASHQNVLAQSEFMSDGFVIGNHDELEALYQKYGVKLNLSGHSHLQHTASDQQLQDICTESLSVAPLRYAQVTIKPDGTWDYEKKDLGILQQEAYQRFSDTVKRQVSQEKLDVTDAEKEVMTDFAVRANYAYFSGDLNAEELKKEPGWKLWEEKGRDSFWYLYMKSYLE